MDKREKQVVLYYLNNLSQKSFYKDKEEAILSWIGDTSEDLFGIDLDSQWDASGAKHHPHLRRRRVDSDPLGVEKMSRPGRSLGLFWNKPGTLRYQAFRQSMGVRWPKARSAIRQL
jgi:hypothetical protein